MINVGDRVKFISDTGVGIVRSVSQGIAKVEVDGFEIPALLSDIIAVDIAQENAAVVRIGPDAPKAPRQGALSRMDAKASAQNYGKVTVDKQWQDDEPVDVARLKRDYAATQRALTKDQKAVVVEPKREIPPYELTDYQVKLIFVPSITDRQPEECDLDMYLVNDSTYQLFYSIGLVEKQGWVTTLGSGPMEDDTKIKVHHFKRMQLNNVMRLRISILPYKPLNYTPHKLTDTELELHPLKFVREGNYLENDFFDERAIVFDL
ncbi:MAG: DUF2027 domain-containing protein [Mucinivorans sp.]